MRRLFRVIVAAAAVAASIAILSTAFADKQMPPTIKTNPDRWPADRITIANLGHASLLMNFLGVLVLTDPSLFDKVGLSFDSIFTIGPKRVTAPPLAPADLQDVQLILF